VHKSNAPSMPFALFIGEIDVDHRHLNKGGICAWPVRCWLSPMISGGPSRG
jgi:hypothetical protein